MADSITPELARKRLKQTYRQHGDWTTEVMDAFDSEVERISLKSVTALVGRLLNDLAFDPKGTIAHTPLNLRTLGRIDKLYRELLDKYGYSRTIHRFVAEFPGQLPLLTEVLDNVASTLQTPFTVPKTLLTGSDMAALKTQQTMSGQNLSDLAVTLGTQAKRTALLAVGGLNRQNLTETLAAKLGKLPGEASTLGATSLSIFYRTATAQAFEKIQKTQKAPLRYTYDGPEDKLNRPFCAAMCKKRDRGLTWTRREIAAMDNGQLPNTFHTCGGYNCRHQWRLALQDEL